MNASLTLAAAIVAEVTASRALKAGAGFNRLGPSCVVTVGYASAFHFLSLTLRHLTVGIAYAIWSGVVTALITLIGVFTFRQKLNLAGLCGISLTIAGVLVPNLPSKANAH